MSGPALTTLCALSHLILVTRLKASTLNIPILKMISRLGEVKLLLNEHIVSGRAKIVDSKNLCFKPLYYNYFMMTLHSWQIELHKIHDPPPTPSYNTVGETERIFKTPRQIQNENCKHFMGKLNGV